MAKPDVKCVVDTCTHWVPGNLCSAAGIDILYEEEGRMAATEEHTECKTFALRSSMANMIGSADNVNWTGLITEPVLPGHQMIPQVTCIVESCRYWDTGDRCVAEAIEITGRGANECQDTNCETFINREK